VILSVATATQAARPGQPIPVEATLKEGETPQAVSLLYRNVTKGAEGPEAEVAMTLDSASGSYKGEIPAQASGALVRYRVRATGDKGAQRYYPATGDLRPALSVYVHDKWEMAGIPFGFILGGPNEPKVSQAFFRAKPLPPPPPDRGPGGPGGPGGPPGPGGPVRRFRGPGDFLAFMTLQNARADQAGKMTLKSFNGVIQKWSAQWDADKDQTITLKEMEKGVNALVGFVEADEQDGGGPGGFSPGAFLSPPIMKALGGSGDKISAQQFNTRFASLGKTWDENKSGGLDNDELSAGWTQLIPPPNFGGPGRRPGPPGGDSSEDDPGAGSDPPRGASTFIYVDPKDGAASVYDYVAITSRNRGDMYRGYKVHFFKDQMFKGQSTVNFVYEGVELSLLTEDMAYDVYHRLGEPAPLSEFMRLWVDGKMVGYHLIVERPNRSFLRRNQIDDEGNLYKLLWYGGDIVGQHEKKTHVRAGHQDLLTLVDQLNKTQGDAQWKVIQDNFDVDEVATYFAVNMILSHWDGFFNNYYTYHDTDGTKKWQMYPWDQDKTWGITDDGETVFYDMPLNFGMNGAVPPGSHAKPPKPGEAPFIDDGPFWWRPPGFFSGPLLANPHFRQIFLARVREILTKVYTQDTYFPLIDRLADQLKQDIRLESKESGEPVVGGLQAVDRYAQHLKDHLSKRRQFLLEQKSLAMQPK
jgi:hypothetical protein